MREAIILFTRLPIPGYTKTRLMPFLSGEDCAGLHRAMLMDIREAAGKTGAELLLCYENRGEASELMRLRGLLGTELPCFPQRGEGLGERMKEAFWESFRRGYDRVVLTGTDIPDISTEIYREGLRALESHNLVLHPTVDGGYYLIGMKEPQDYIWEVKGYGGSTVLRESLKRAQAEGKSVYLGTRLRDVDTGEDLKSFLLSEGAEKRAPRTFCYGKRFFPEIGDGFRLHGEEEKI